MNRKIFSSMLLSSTLCGILSIHCEHDVPLQAPAVTINQEDIYHGSEAVEDLLRDVSVGIADKSDGDISCTGVVVASDWVLTASHCFKDRFTDEWETPEKIKSNYDIQLGGKMAGIGRVELQKYEWHNNLNINLYDNLDKSDPNYSYHSVDLCLLQIDDSGEIKKFTEVVELIEIGHKHKFDQKFYIVGYGLFKNHAVSSDTLRQGITQFKGYWSKNSEELHFSWGDNIACNGDSGGGAFIKTGGLSSRKYYLAGISSRYFSFYVAVGGELCSEIHDGNIYVNLAFEPTNAWIRKHIQS